MKELAINQLMVNFNTTYPFSGFLMLRFQQFVKIENKNNKK